MSAREALDRTLRLLVGDIFPSSSPEQLAVALTRSAVLVTADADNLSSPAAQSAVVATFICLCELGFEVVLEIPEVDLLGPQPPLRGEGLREGLIDLGRDLITCPATSPDGDPLARVAIGTSEPPAGEAPLVRVGGDGWSARVGNAAVPVPRFSGGPPFGAILAGAAASAEVLRILCARFARDQGLTVAQEFDLLGPRAVEIDLPPLPLSGRTDLGRLEIVSAGAITNSLLFALLRCRGIRALGRLYDDDLAAESNLNRYPLLRRSWLGLRKVEILADVAAGIGAGMRLEAIGRRLDRDLAGGLRGADQVLVGVDDIPSRWLAQRRASGHLAVAATSHFAAMVSEHDPQTPCAGCLHPRDDPDGPPLLPTISFVSMLAGVLQAYRVLAHATPTAFRPPTLVAGFNLWAPGAVTTIGLGASPICPVGCRASRELVAAGAAR